MVLADSGMIWIAYRGWLGGWMDGRNSLGGGVGGRGSKAIPRIAKSIEQQEEKAVDTACTKSSVYYAT